MNKVILIGRLTANPDYRQTAQGTSLCRFTVAVDRPYVKNGGERQADFINVVAWSNNADFISRYFTKGKPIIVEGSLRNNNYTDQNGVKHYSMEVLVDRASFCLSDNASNNGGYSQQYGNGYGQGNNYGQGGYGGNSYGNGYNQSQGGYIPQDNSYYQPQPQQNAPYQQPQANVNIPNPNNANVSNEPTNNAPANSQSANGNGSDDLQLGNLQDFEEILSDGEIPF